MKTFTPSSSKNILLFMTFLLRQRQDNAQSAACKCNY